MNIKTRIEKYFRERKLKKVKELSNEDLFKQSLKKVIYKDVIVSGLCGDVERCRIIAISKVDHTNEGRIVYVYTDNEEHPELKLSESTISKMI